MKLGALFTGGKDSTYSIYSSISKGDTVSCLMNMISENADSYMFHTVGSNLVGLQAEAIGIPLERFYTKGKKEEELTDLKEFIHRMKDKYGIEGVVSGAIASEYQLNRIGGILGSLGLVSVTPLWRTDVEEYMRRLVSEGFKVVIVSVSADGLDESWLGKEITEGNLNELIALSRKHRFHLGFEGGEAETAVLDGPMFKKRVVIRGFEVENDGPKHYMKVTAAELEDKR